MLCPRATWSRNHIHPAALLVFCRFPNYVAGAKLAPQRCEHIRSLLLDTAHSSLCLRFLSFFFAFSDLSRLSASFGSASCPLLFDLFRLLGEAPGISEAFALVVASHTTARSGVASSLLSAVNSKLEVLLQLLPTVKFDAL